MAVSTRAARGLVAASAAALLLTACSGNSGSSSSSSSSGSSASGAGKGNVVAWSSEPQNPLIPANTNETGGTKIIDSIGAGLVYYDAKGAPHNELAQPSRRRTRPTTRSPSRAVRSGRTALRSPPRTSSTPGTTRHSRPMRSCSARFSRRSTAMRRSRPPRRPPRRCPASRSSTTRTSP